MRVLDLSWLLPGPFFTGMFADLGADVLKVERPGDGDYTRTLLPGMFNLVNRGKRSAVVDLRTEAGREAVLQLAARADVFVEGFRPGVMKRLGVGYEAVRARNAGIVYVSLTGYGQDGPAARAPGHDLNYCGHAGLLGIPAAANQDGEPPRMQLPVSDIAGAMYAAVSTLAALRERDRTGEGQWLDVSLAQAALGWSAVRWADAPRTAADDWRHLNVANDAFRAADGVRLAVALVEHQFWDAFVQGLTPAEKQRMEREGSTPGGRQVVLRELFASKPSDWWLDYAKLHDLPISRIATRFEEVVTDPVFAGRDAWIQGDASEHAAPAFPVPLRGLPRHARAPKIGEATDSLEQFWKEAR